jgi:hypothetical protein
MPSQRSLAVRPARRRLVLSFGVPIVPCQSVRFHATKALERSGALNLDDALQKTIIDDMQVAVRCARERQEARSIGGGRVSRKRKLRRFAPGLLLKVRDRYANESNAFGWWEYRSDKTKSQLMQLLPRFDRHFHRPAAGGNLKVGPFDLHGDRPAAGVRLLAPGPDIVSHRDHGRLDLNGMNQVLGESRFRSRRFSFAVSLDRPVVLTARDLVKSTPRLAAAVVVASSK